MDRLGSDIRRSLAAAGAPEAGDLTDLVRAWPAAVGDGIARAAWPLRIGRDGVLQIAASSSAWSFELGLMAAEILERLRAAVPTTAITGLRFAPGPVPSAPAVSAAGLQPLPASPTAADLEQAAALAAAIEDPVLRESVARAAAASLARARSDRHF
jgi:hypothetical protein